MNAVIKAVSLSSRHAFSKANVLSIRLIEGHGVEHRSRVAKDPSAPNLRQVHLMHAELFDELQALGFSLKAGDMGENVTTHGVDLLALPVGTRLKLGDEAVVEVTGLRNPCSQIDKFQPGLMKATLGRDAQGGLIRKAGVMAIVLAGGEVRPGDTIGVELPQGAPRKLEPV